MPEDIREYIRAAQAAEIRGDKSQAIQLLKQAAKLYESAGNRGRSLQMLRHATRLESDGAEVGESLRDPPRASPGALSIVPQSTGPHPDAPNRKAALAKQLADRGPTLADPAADAWCSFCCRPRAEVGALVAGPAGAFVCAGCLRHATRLLGREEPALGPAIALARPSAAPSAPVPAIGGAARVEFFDPYGVIPKLVDAMREGAKLVLLLGLPGSGKTACLRALEARGLGAYLAGGDSLPERLEGVLLVDGEDGMDEKVAQRFAAAVRSSGRCVLAVRGEVPTAKLSIRGERASRSLYTTRELLSACGARLPVELLELANRVLALESSAGHLAEIARRLAAARVPALTLSAELIAAVASEALRSGRGGHEVKALIDRLPDGAWTLAAVSPGRRSRRRKGGRS